MVRIGSITIGRREWEQLSPTQKIVVVEGGEAHAATFEFSATSLDRNSYRFIRTS